MKPQEAIQSQYLAALKMLREAIVKCPAAAWDAAEDKDRVWFKVQHALYWTHRFLQTVDRGFARWKGHRRPDPKTPVSRADMLQYLEFIQSQLVERNSGAGAVRAERLETAIAGIRHIQQHTGELFERLGSREHLTLHWTEEVHRDSK